MRLLAVALLASASAASVSAQDADEHAAHHPATADADPTGAMAPGSAPAAAMPSTTSAMPAGAAEDAGMAEMAGMMRKMDTAASCCGPGQDNGPFFSRLLTLPDLDQKARQALARDAEARVHRGLVLASEGAAEGAHASDSTARAAAARKLREGADLYASGVAGKSALEGDASGPTLATDWFRTQLSVGTVLSGAHTAHPFGISPAHLLLMLFLTLLSASLIALQLFRLQRIRKIVAVAPTVSGGAAGGATGGGREAAAPATATALGAAKAVAPSSVASLAPRKPRSWTGVLRVAQILRETPTILTFRFADPAADRLPFDFLPGQFLQVEVEPEPGKSARRSYTIASSPTQRAYAELSVKREEQGAVSRYLHDHVKVGDLVKVSGPFGAFTFTGTDADSIVLIAGGVGITPMMSVLRYLTDTAWPGEIFFLYGARSTEEFAFREDIERLERRHDNLHVFAAMHRAPGAVWHGAEGPLTKDMLTSVVPDLARRRIHLCGPPAMMAAMKAQLAELGVPEAQLHTEAFGPASLPMDPLEPPTQAAPVAQPGPTPASPVAIGAETTAATITFSVSGVSAPLPANQTVLEAAEGAGVEIPYSCRVGECGVCVTKLVDGEVTMAVESGLAPQDKAQGYILACQAKTTGQPLVVEA
ncbi:2Fe-2S iron-sulfur cluster-binding protein [Caulobacter sp. 1776]|uniref:2Fe-2S iron-sulfur cluster-binding protein n=1 Tax=Caulobacter sp. 1776 TaxID=3156420 RepID=UPI003397E83C